MKFRYKFLPFLLSLFPFFPLSIKRPSSFINGIQNHVFLNTDQNPKPYTISSKVEPTLKESFQNLPTNRCSSHRSLFKDDTKDEEELLYKIKQIEAQRHDNTITLSLNFFLLFLYTCLACSICLFIISKKIKNGQRRTG